MTAAFVTEVRTIRRCKRGFRPGRRVASCAVAPTDVRLAIAPYDYAAAERLAAELGVSHVTAQVLVRRGFGERRRRARVPRRPACRTRSTPSAGCARAPRSSSAHVVRGSRITVHGDYDVDGVSATAVLVRALRTLGADVDWYLPSRIDDGYGLALGDRGAARRARDRAAGDGRTARSPRSRRSPPRARPGWTSWSPTTTRRAPTGGCPTRRSCTRASAATRARSCARPASRTCSRGALLEAAGLDPGAADADLDLVALATVADCVPLVGENRRLVRAGLRALASTRKPGLQALMDVARVDPSGVDASAIGFRLAPRINAAGRLHRADAGLELLLTADVERARAVAAELDAVQHRAPRRRDADPVRRRGAGRGGPRGGRRGRAGGLRARGRGLASRA